MQHWNINSLTSDTSPQISLKPTKLSIEELISDIEYPNTSTSFNNYNTQTAPFKNNLKPTMQGKDLNQNIYFACICKQLDFICPIIECITCKKSHHPICHGFFSPTDIRCKNFVCLGCKKFNKQHVNSLIRMRKLVYFIYQMNTTVKSSEIISGCMISSQSYSYIMATLSRKVNIHDLFEIYKKGTIKFHKPKGNEISKEILLKIFNGSMDM